jgi:glycosyltransferase involved in cell wall biosynthesis
MACEVPCIGTNVGGVPEVISDGINGFLCEVGDIEGFSTKAISLLSDIDMHQQFSTRAVEIVKTKFNADQILEQYEQLYFNLLN